MPASRTRDRFFYSDIYALGYLLLSECSREPSVLAPAIKNHWDSAATKQCRGLLDVGAADGRITELLWESFQNVHVYEPNEVLFSLLNCRLSERRCLYAFNRSWNYSTPIHDSISHILMSHVLYHIPITRWQKLMEMLLGANNGSFRTITFVLWRDNAEAHKFCKKVNPDRWHVTAEDLIAQIVSLGKRIPRLEIYVSDVHPIIKTETRGAAEAISTFLLGRAHPDTRQGRSDRKALIECLTAEGINNSQTIVTVSLGKDNA